MNKFRFSLIVIWALLGIGFCFGETLEPGQKVTDSYVSTKWKHGTSFVYKIYKPMNCGNPNEVGLIIGFDGNCPSEAMEKLAATGAMPPCVIIGIEPGILKTTSNTGVDRWMRAEEYDHVGRDFPEFIVKEFIPAMTEKYDLKFSSSPDMHMVTGGSSGGLATWNALWYANDYFHRGFMPSPTFGNFDGGEELLAVARKAETRPIRVAATCGSHEPFQFAGNSMVIAFSAFSALQYAGYDCLFEFRPNDNHCQGQLDWTIQKKMYSFLWSGWKDEAVAPWHSPERVESVVDPKQPWQQTAEAMPQHQKVVCSQGEYTFRGNTIFFAPKNGKKKIAATDFDEITGLALSSDLWRLYVSDKNRRKIFAMTIEKDGTLSGRYELGSLHTLPDNLHLGASSLCVDTLDRVYAATDIGIQGITSVGINDLIIPLPGDLTVDEIAFGGENMDWLYARSGNMVFKRKCKIAGRRENQAETAKYKVLYTY